MRLIKNLKSKLFEIEKKLGVTFTDQDLLFRAFVHPSFINENRSPKLESYERLEFLGDSVLGLLVSHWLYKVFPKASEGELSWMRASLVDAGSCATYLNILDLHTYILTSKGEGSNVGKGRYSIFSDVFEAVLAAIYIDQGMEQTERFFKAHMEPVLEKKIKTLSQNPKIVLQSYVQKLDHTIPQYTVISEEGPEHEKRFVVAVSHGEEFLGQGSGLSKKQAQYEAAKQALIKLGIE